MPEEIVGVLVVDDEEEIRKILSRILEQEGFKVVTAPNGQQAMQKICFDAPDAVLLDVRMPGLNGMEVLKKIKEIDETSSVKLGSSFQIDFLRVNRAGNI